MYYKDYNKKEIIKRVCESAKVYKENLLNKNIMFLYSNKNDNSIDFIETVFFSQNFLHFTGLNYNKSSKEFFKECISNILLPESIKIKNKGFTELKLDVLENAMSINKSAKRIGDFNQNKANIKIEKIIGNTHLCLGFSNLNQKNEKLRFYYPKTLIQDNLKNNIIKDKRIIAIFSKSKKENLYKEVTYFSKDVNLYALKERKEIYSLIDYENLNSSNLKYQEIVNQLRRKTF